jgi:crotonobetainyl-CoA:carnitine CoA-transferase CaiB-like acyl-CoA transferase
MSGPLHGIRIIDLTTVLAGPTATQLLGDYGADVIKVESPDGDLMRAAGPARHSGMGHVFLNTNRNKRSIVLDLKKSEAREVLLRLTQDADVFAYNVRAQSMQRLGLDYEAVRAVNPRIIYAGALGFSQRGPYAARPAYDDLIQGMAGIPWLSIRAGSEVPRYAPTVFADRTEGLHMAVAILAALQHRSRTGEGQRVDIPMYEVMVASIMGEHLAGRLFDPPLGDIGYSRSLAPDRRPYKTLDGFICVIVYNDTHWRNFSRLIGQPDLMDRDARFSSQQMRLKNIEVVTGFLKDIVATRTTDEWMRLLQAADVPVGPMNSLHDIREDPHLAALDFFRQVQHPSEGTLTDVAIPTEWSASPPEVRRLAPRIGEHTVEILREAGFASADIDSLARTGALGAFKEEKEICK